MSRMALNTFLGTFLMFLATSAYQAAASPLKSYALDSSKVALGVPGKLASGPGFHWESAVASGVGAEVGQFGPRSTEAVSSNAAAGTSPGLARSDLTPPQPGGVDASTPSSSSVTQSTVSGLGQASEPPSEAASRASPISLGTVAPGGTNDHGTIGRPFEPGRGSRYRFQSSTAGGRGGGGEWLNFAATRNTRRLDRQFAGAGCRGCGTGRDVCSGPDGGRRGDATEHEESVNASPPPAASAGTTPSSGPSTSSSPNSSSGPNSSSSATTPAGTTGSSGTVSAATTASLASLALPNPPGQVPSTNNSGPAGSITVNPGRLRRPPQARPPSPARSVVMGWWPPVPSAMRSRAPLRALRPCRQAIFLFLWCP